MKTIYGVMVALLVLLSVSGLGAAVTITGLLDISTTDTTPTATFTVVGNNTSYLATLYIDTVSVGTVTATNNTEASITVSPALASGFSGTYYVTAYNSTEVPTLTNSTTYNITTSNFAGIVSVLGDVVPIFTPIVDLIIAAGTVMIAIAMIAFIMGLMLTVFGAVGGAMKRMGK